ncbi:MAG: ABC transporter transmembrane domain-containing protein [Roseobacter sp.]
MAVTLTLFPFLFLTLELPKRIINDAIGAQTAEIDLFGIEVTKEHYLWLLCIAFLLSVFVHGLLKMQINTMKGTLSEQLLRRLRYSLISRMLKFPKAYFQRTSQGELVAMITGETEPMGGMMGDALTQPALQAGQMLTILFFLFLQSFWFGLAAIALIPLQAWLIPRLQRQINLMNKARIKEVRSLAGIIGESAAGAGDLRSHGGWRYQLSMITDKLGVVFSIRLKIYQKKFYMKFLNNFITQLTPFFFFSIGGYLVIHGAVSLGALVAALAAYKDLSPPWKELLTYYNQAQDMSLRWHTVVEKFSPPGVIEDRLMDNAPDQNEKLTGSLIIENICVADNDGNLVLDNISLNIPQGALVGIAAASEEDRLALADLLTRELIPIDGNVLIAGKNLNSLHQSTLSKNIGHANSKPKMFRGSFGENAVMALRSAPIGELNKETNLELSKAIEAGNSNDPFKTKWLDPKQAGVIDDAELRVWWMSLIQAIGSDGPMFRKSLDQIVDERASVALQTGLVRIRPKIWRAVVEADLDKYVHRFDPEQYNPALPVTSNLFFATLKKPTQHHELAVQNDVLSLLRKLGLENGLLEISQDMIEFLNQIFGTDGTEHPLFRKLGLDPTLFEKSVQIIRSLKTGSLKALTDAEKAILMTLPARVSAEQIGPAFTKEMKERIVLQRSKHKNRLQNALDDTYVPFDVQNLTQGISVLENALFGKVSESAGARADDLRRVVTDLLEEEGLKSAVIDLIYDLPLTLNGSNLPAIFAEPLALIRAVIKRPSIVVLDQILASYDRSTRIEVHKNLRLLLPETTFIYISDRFDNPDRFDVYAKISHGRMETAISYEVSPEDTVASADLQNKVRALETTDMFMGLDRRQLRLLAFGAKWFSAKAGEGIFNIEDDPSDGVYLILSGTVELFKPQGSSRMPVAKVGQGKLVGELGLIRNVPRALSMRAETDVEALRIGAEEFLAVVENDAATSFKLLQVVAGYTS